MLNRPLRRDWPGSDEPVVIQAGRPGRHRPRLNTEHMIPHAPVYYQGPDGQLLMPAGGGVHRSASVSGRPASINIYNDNAAAWDDHSGRRPLSAHGSLYYDDVEGRIYERRRSSSRVRRPSASPKRELDSDTKEKLKEYEEIKKREEEKAQQKRIEERLLMEKIKRENEAAEREREDKELKKRAIEEYRIKEEEERIKKRKEKEKEDEEFKDRMRKTLWANGYSSDQIERMMKKAEKKESGGGESSAKALVLNRPTYIKVHRKHLDPETLDVYQLPWEWDDVSIRTNHNPSY